MDANEGAFTFRFKSKEKPVWFEQTLVSAFRNEDPDDTEGLIRREQKAKTYDGVTVSSYDYLDSEAIFEVSICLPKRLLVYGRNK